MGNFNKLKRQQGFSMVELMLVFAIILGLAAMVFYVYPKVQESRIASEEQTNLTALQAGVKSVYQGRANYATLTPTILLNAQVVPNNMVNGADIVNRFREVVAVAPATLGGGTADNGFSFTYTGVSQAACTKLAVSLGSTFDVVNIGGVDAKAFGDLDTNEATATTQCAAGLGANTMIFSSR